MTSHDILGGGGYKVAPGDVSMYSNVSLPIQQPMMYPTGYSQPYLVAPPPPPGFVAPMAPDTNGNGGMGAGFV